jgi:hypothetical protein
MKIKLNDEIVVIDPKYPLCGFTGKVVGIRGQTIEGYNWLLVFFPVRMRSYLVPENYCERTNKE